MNKNSCRKKDDNKEGIILINKAHAAAQPQKCDEITDRSEERTR